MSPNAVRAAALAIGIGAFLSRLTVVFWVEPITEQIEPDGLRVPLRLLALVVSVGVPLVIFTWLVAPRRLRPATFQIDPTTRRFVVAASPRGPGGQAIFLFWFAGGFVLTERGPDGERVGFGDWPFPAFHIVMFSLLIACALAMPFIRYASLGLTPSGITIRRSRRNTVIDWDELATGGPSAPGFTSHMQLYRRGWQPGAGPLRTDDAVPVGMLDVQPAFLAAAIRQYVEQPQHRAGIGTEAELARLRADLATTPSDGIEEIGTAPTA